MAHIHLNVAARRYLFNWLTRLPGYDARWRLMRRLAKALKIKELNRELDDAVRATARKLALSQAAQEEPDEAGRKPAGVALFDLRVAAGELERAIRLPKLCEPDQPTQQFRLDDGDVEAVYALTAPLRTEPEKGKDGAVVAEPCKACGRGGTTVAGDYEVYGAICDALEDAYQSVKHDRPCPVCQERARQAQREEVPGGDGSDGSDGARGEAADQAGASATA